MKEKIVKYENIIIGMIAFVTSFFMGISFNVPEHKIIYNNPNSFIWIIMLIYIIITLKYALQYQEKRVWCCASILGMGLSIATTIGFFMEKYANIMQQVSAQVILFLMVKLLVYFVILTPIIVILIKAVSKITEKTQDRPILRNFTNNKRSFFIVTGLLLLAYLPHLLNYFPGNGVLDSSTQILQALGVTPWTNHHPAFHTFCIMICLKIGNFLFHTYTAGFAMYTILQVIATCLTFSFVIYYMAAKKVPIGYRIGTLVFFIVCPIIPLYSLTMIKDVPFALSIVLLTISFIEMITNTKSFFQSKLKLSALAILLLTSMFFRNNGIYVVILSFIGLLIFFRKECKKLILIFLSTMMIYIIVTGPVYHAMNIRPGSIKEALSVPLQQFARITKYKQEELTKQEREKIYQYLPVDNLGDLYLPLSSDPVKVNFSQEGFNQDRLGLIKLYMKLALKYPGQTMLAFFSNSYGYYYPDTLGWEVSYGIKQQEFKENPNGNYGIERKPIVPIKLLDEINDFINRKDLPLVSIILSSGFYFWILCFGCMLCIYNKKYKLLLVYMPVLFVWLTTLASPVFCESRYVYSLFLCSPLLIGVTIWMKNDIKEDEK